jgi:hypothetical protein
VPIDKNVSDTDKENLKMTCTVCHKEASPAEVELYRSLKVTLVSCSSCTAGSRK